MNLLMFSHFTVGKYDILYAYLWDVLCMLSEYCNNMEDAPAHLAETSTCVFL
jgi:hypothetical protein